MRDILRIDVTSYRDTNDDKCDPLFCRSADVTVISEKHSCDGLLICLSRHHSYSGHWMTHQTWLLLITYRTAPDSDTWHRCYHSGERKTQGMVMYVLHMSDELRTSVMDVLTSIMDKLKAALIEASLLCFMRTYVNVCTFVILELQCVRITFFILN